MTAVKNNVSRFPAWGPYSKKYMGISHIVNQALRPGVRFDLTTVPTIANLDIHLPNVTVPTGWHPWNAGAGGKQFTYRVDLEWKDVVYGDVSYTCLDDHTVLIRTELVNHSELNQNLMINHFASIEYPQRVYVDPVIPEGAVMLDALDYDSMTYASTRPWDSQNPDGLKRGEVVEDRYTSGHGMGDRAGKWHLPQLEFGTFGEEAGDAVSYIFDLEKPMPGARLFVRYMSTSLRYQSTDRMEETVRPALPTKEACFWLNDEKRLSFPVTTEPAILSFPLGDLEAGPCRIRLVSEGQGGLELDFLAIAPEGSSVSVRSSQPSYEPQIVEEVLSDGALVSLSFPDTSENIYLRTFNPDSRFRHIHTGSLEDGMSSRLSNPDGTFDDVLDPFTRSFRRKHSDDGFFHNTLVHTLYLKPGETHIEYAVLSDGPVEYQKPVDYEALYQAYLPAENALTPAGRPYGLSTRLLKAAVLTNIVFPIRKSRQYILHHTPGKRWDSLYTWDSGFIGLGMLDYDPPMAEYILDTYTVEPGFPDYAFLHHGSPVPVQMYLFYEMLQRSSDKTGLLRKYYPRLKYYYEFLVGRGSGSTTGRYKSGLTTTYDYFYSSSGMDDYPAQAHMIHDGLQRSAAPAISCSQVIRSAKILSQAAEALGLSEDAALYQADIDRLSTALNSFSWDPEAGYFSYVLHNEKLEPAGIYRTQAGENLDKGLDGIYPLIAGVCDPTQEERILSHLTSPDEMLCPYGISAVDQSASYFRTNGYWNGHVWFPHQWFIWKTMLDLDQTEFAHTIAHLALEVWKKEVDATHYTFEMVNVTTGRGGWFHNFGGLSTPIGLWANAYYHPGTINAGFDLWIETSVWQEDHTSLELSCRYFGSRKQAALLVVMDPAGPYEVLADGKKPCFRERYPGMLEIHLEGEALAGERLHTLRIFRA